MKINDYMDNIGKDKDKTKQDEKLFQFYNQFLLARINRANTLLEEGRVFGEREQNAYNKLVSLAEKYEDYFNGN